MIARCMYGRVRGRGVRGKKEGAPSSLPDRKVLVSHCSVLRHWGRQRESDTCTTIQRKIRR